MDEVSSKGDKDSQSEWRKLAAIAILYFAARNLKGIASSSIYALPALAISYDKIAQNQHIWLPALLTLLGLVLVVAFLQYHFYRYRLADEQVEVRAGIFAKKHLNLPFARIQNVKIEQPFYYRPFGYASLELDTAGSSKQEARIVALDLASAQQLKLDILASKHIEKEPDTHSNAEQVATELSNGEQLLNQRSIADLIIHGLTNNRVWLFLGGLAPFYDNIFDFIGQKLLAMGIDIQAIFSSNTIAWWQLGLYALSLAMIFMLFIVLFSIAGSILVFYDFRLSRTKDSYIRRCGLLSKQEVSMKLSRLQLLLKKQDWLDILLKRSNLLLEQNKTGVGDPNHLNHANKILVPSVKDDECNVLIADAMPGNQLTTIAFRPISARFLWRAFLMLWLPLAIACVFANTYSDNPILFPIGIATLILVALMIFTRWYRWGYALDEDFIYIRKGLFGVTHGCFPIYKIQQVAFKQSILMRNKKLASLSILLASGNQSIPFIEESIAYSIFNKSLYIVESQKQSWM